MAETYMPTVDQVIHQNIRQCMTWGMRAGMAIQQSNDELTKQALQRAWQYQTALAKLIEADPPAEPLSPEDVERWLVEMQPFVRQKTSKHPPDPDFPTDRYQPSRVPLRPLPTSGAGEIALPLPKKSNDFETE
jgi:hypothetical protein